MAYSLLRHCHPGLDPGSIKIDSRLRGNDKKVISLLLLTAFLSLFLPNAFLFAKWTRFISPTFPFFAIFTAFFFFKLSHLQFPKIFNALLITIHLSLVALWSFAFFTIYLHPDIRLTASSWLESHVPSQSTFLVEGGNVVDLPLKGNFERLSLDFYNLENDVLARQKVASALEQADYFLIESRRVFKNHQRLPQQFPRTARFYNSLFNGQLGFTQIKEFTSYPHLELGDWNLEFPDETAEETWSVFDHPVIRVFQKTRQRNEEEYTKLLGD